MKPDISIIIPIYKVEEYLPRCIDSILAQTFTNFEVILVNDGSPDGSGKICDEYAERDSRIKVVHKENGGLSSARNAGISISSGKYIGFVDSDDYINKDMYSKLYELCERTNSQIGICNFKREVNVELQDVDDELIIKELDNQAAMKELFRGVLYRFSACNKLFHSSCFNGVKFPEGRIHEDLATTYKLFSNSRKSVYTNYPGYVYVKRENSILTDKYNSKRLQAFLTWEEILKFMMEKYLELKEEYIACFAYWSIDNIIYISRDIESANRSKYIKEIILLLKKYYKDIMINHKLSLKCKVRVNMVIATNINWIIQM
ncbi:MULTISPECIES: glycosyltransferase family 2 protein [unclassified Clostridium]|uniref:glycosyltransferase family 2 protein n=1 Tax=unclassified Clostridium TaxID=2614128 RepID=UPI00321621CC